MALKLGFSALSLGASVDQQTGGLSVFDVVEELRSPSVPFQMQSLVISLGLIKTGDDEEKGSFLIHVFGPGGNQAKVGEGQIRVPPEQKRMKAVFRLSGFPFHEFGSHRFVVSWLDDGGAKMGEAILDFEVLQAAGGGQPQKQEGSGQMTH